jgi:hypothetical protein
MNTALLEPASHMSVIPSRLALAVLASAWFARILVAAGCPTAVNFAHFPLLALSVTVVIATSRNRLAAELLAGLLCLAGVMAASALLNGAGLINVALDFLLLAEPFLLLLLMIESRWPANAIRQFRAAILLMLGLHLLMAYYQRLALGLQDDYVRGLFLSQLAGAHVAGAVAMTGGVYFGINWGGRTRLQGILFGAASVLVVVFADAKQVLVAFMGALLVLMLLRCCHLRTAAKYLLIATAAAGTLVVAAQTFFPALMSCNNPDIAWTGLANKLQVFPLLAQRCDNPWQWLLGLGPGHTVGRLGWLLPDYMPLLAPLGATTSPTTHLIMNASHASWLSSVQQGSSMWSMLFSWAAILGDLGLVGTAIYTLLWTWVSKKICHNDLGRFLVLCALVFGCIFAWLEEPAYMLLVAALIALNWQEQQHALGASSQTGGCLSRPLPFAVPTLDYIPNY